MKSKKRAKPKPPLRHACGFAASFHNATQTKLIPRAHRLAGLPLDLDHLFTVHRPSRFIGEPGDDLAAGDIDNIAGRRIGVLAVEAERDPARLLADFDAGDLPGRHDRRVEDVHPAVMRIADPQLFLVGSQSDAVAWAAVPLHRTGLETRDLD